jgi:hypothetical protein
VTGQTRCYWHGAASPQARNAAARRSAQQKARRALERAGVSLERVEDPLATFEKIAAEAVLLKDALAARLASLKAGPHADPGTLDAVGVALDRAARLTGQLIALNLPARRARLAQEDAEVLARLVRDSLRDPRYRSAVASADLAESERAFRRALGTRMRRHAGIDPDAEPVREPLALPART